MSIQTIGDLTSFKWATVTAINPIEIRLDGDTAALDLIPDSLLDPMELKVGSRVRVELSLRKVVIHGKSGGGLGATPVGAGMAFYGSVAPSGWLICNGAPVSRTTYSALFLVIGTTYGSGDGSTTFNLPDMRKRVAVGYDSSDTDFNAIGKTGGEKSHTLTTAEMPSHSHPAADGAKFTLIGPGSQGLTGSPSVSIASNSNTGSTGGGTAHNNLQPYLAANFVIKT